VPAGASVAVRIVGPDPDGVVDEEIVVRVVGTDRPAVVRIGGDVAVAVVDLQHDPVCAAVEQDIVRNG